MKKVPCSCPTCGDRRAHYERPDEPRGKPVMLEVPDDFSGFYYCSFECKVYHEAMLAEAKAKADGKEPKP